MTNLIRFAAIISLVIFCVEGCHAQPSKQGRELSLITTIALPGVSGRIDHLSFDSSTQRLFIAALGNNTVEVVDLKTNKVIHSITGLSEPQGIAFIPAENKLIVANGGNGTYDVFNAATYQKLSSLQLDGDADNVRYDAINKKVYVGYGEGGIAIIDAATLRQEADIKLQGHPESFQLDVPAKRLYVNVPDKQQVEVLDLNTLTVINRWKITDARANFPMVLDAVNHRLFIGCRHPAELLVLDTKTGKPVASAAIDSDTDDIFYNRTDSSIYISCGAGYLNIIKQLGGNQYRQIGQLTTRSGARTSLFIPQINRLVIASPKGIGRDAEILVYEVR